MIPFVSYSQIAPETKTDSTGVPIPQAIKVVDIIQKVEEANKELKLSYRKIGFGNRVSRIDSLFPDYAKFIKAQLKRKDHFVSANPNRQKITEMRARNTIDTVK